MKKQIKFNGIIYPSRQAFFKAFEKPRPNETAKTFYNRMLIKWNPDYKEKQKRQMKRMLYNMPLEFCIKQK